MKIKREIEVVVCDFCKNDAWKKCPLCGKDICQNHDLTLHLNFRKYNEGYAATDFDKYPHSKILTRHFCPDHLTPELEALLIQSCNRRANPRPLQAEPITILVYGIDRGRQKIA